MADNNSEIKLIQKENLSYTQLTSPFTNLGGGRFECRDGCGAEVTFSNLQTHINFHERIGDAIR